MCCVYKCVLKSANQLPAAYFADTSSSAVSALYALRRSRASTFSFAGSDVFRKANGETLIRLCLISKLTSGYRLACAVFELIKRTVERELSVTCPTGTLFLSDNVLAISALILTVLKSVSCMPCTQDTSGRLGRGRKPSAYPGCHALFNYVGSQSTTTV